MKLTIFLSALLIVGVVAPPKTIGTGRTGGPVAKGPGNGAQKQPPAKSVPSGGSKPQVLRSQSQNGMVSKQNSVKKQGVPPVGSKGQGATGQTGVKGPGGMVAKGPGQPVSKGPGGIVSKGPGQPVTKGQGAPGPTVPKGPNGAKVAPGQRVAKGPQSTPSRIGLPLKPNTQTQTQNDKTVVGEGQSGTNGQEGETKKPCSWWSAVKEGAKKEGTEMGEKVNQICEMYKTEIQNKNQNANPSEDEDPDMEESIEIGKCYCECAQNPEKCKQYY